MRLPRRLVGSVVLRWRARGAGPRERAPQGQVKVHVGPTVDNSSGQRGPWLARPTRRAVGLKLTWDWASVCLRGGGGWRSLGDARFLGGARAVGREAARPSHQVRAVLIRLGNRQRQGQGKSLLSCGRACAGHEAPAARLHDCLSETLYFLSANPNNCPSFSFVFL